MGFELEKKEIPGVELDEQGKIISYDIEAQCRSVFKNVRTILEDAGSNWDKLIDVTVFLTNMKDDFSTYNKIYEEYFKNNQPCRTTIEIISLPTPIADSSAGPCPARQPATRRHTRPAAAPQASAALETTCPSPLSHVALIDPNDIAL